MLSKLRNFSKSRLSGVLVFIIIIPFVMWGMGSVFSGGNTNIIAKIILAVALVANSFANCAPNIAENNTPITVNIIMELRE